MAFTYPHLLWLILAVPIFWWGAGFRAFVFGHPNLRIHKESRSWSPLTLLVRACQAVAWSCLVAALARPVSAEYVELIKPGALVLIEQDVSDSETSGVTIDHELELVGASKERILGSGYDNQYMMERQRASKGDPRRIDVSFAAIRLLLKHTHGNPVGLMAFDDAAYKVYPPTTNYDALADSLEEIESYMQSETTQGHGTNFQGPFEKQQDAGALQSACDAFERVSKETVKVLIMSTDGGAPISELRFQQLKSCYQRLGINLIVFGVGEDWYGSSPAKDIQPLQKFVHEVNGLAVPIGDRQAFMQAVARIDLLAERSIYRARGSRYNENYLPWLLAAAGCLVVWGIASAFAREGL